MASLLKEMPSMSTLLSAYASFSALAMLIRTILNEMIPKPMREFLTNNLSDLFSSYFSSDFTFVIEDRWQAVNNETFRAIEVYLPTKIGNSTKSLLLGNNDSNNITAPPKPGIPVDTKVVDEFEGMQLKWTLQEKESKKYYLRNRRHFELKCNKKDKDRILTSYLPHICSTAEEILSMRETLNLYTYDNEGSVWESTVFKHPATFETLAMEPDLKDSIIQDLDLFMQRRKYFQSVGRAWKRGYLLYGPPGTGKSTLVAAIANYLRFHIYDLQLQGVRNDSDLRRILTSTTNRSILLIEDIDCSTKSSRSRARISHHNGEEEEDDRDRSDNKVSLDPGVTLSGLLNFIDGLWSSCGDERIIIFTTNYKDKLDPALLRPGRMDVHIYMGHCTPAGFRKLAATYLGIKDHLLFKCIGDLIESVAITPAEVAQQLMKCDDPQVALDSLIELINKKGHQVEDELQDKKGEEEVIKQEIIMLGKGDVKLVEKHNKEKIEERCVYLT
ncbi:AAA-ATPase At1g43910 [Ricinus communis]|uniref:ATP binding protein, putative n=1 Tax=Ricinus communis TaxID=3988 RepID=B9S6A0_RICCO|nr:AAA-ATPase At1g43910 [Ricinus communis]EEF40790.1 ATP binding protein, putative [Ricinus communis]|eukprot:XP_002521519.1 AAA-ATPase At1g43910 [Ricinus communis]